MKKRFLLPVVAILFLIYFYLFFDKKWPESPLRVDKFPVKSKTHRTLKKNPENPLSFGFKKKNTL